MSSATPKGAAPVAMPVVPMASDRVRAFLRFQKLLDVNLRHRLERIS